MNYWDNVTEIYEKQRRKGIKAYGQTLEENTSLNIIERIEMAQEEMVDMLVYLEHVKAVLNGKKN